MSVISKLKHRGLEALILVIIVFGSMAYYAYEQHKYGPPRIGEQVSFIAPDKRHTDLRNDNYDDWGGWWFAAGGEIISLDDTSAVVRVYFIDQTIDYIVPIFRLHFTSR